MFENFQNDTLLALCKKTISVFKTAAGNIPKMVLSIKNDELVIKHNQGKPKTVKDPESGLWTEIPGKNLILNFNTDKENLEKLPISISEESPIDIIRIEKCSKLKTLEGFPPLEDLMIIFIGKTNIPDLQLEHVINRKDGNVYELSPAGLKWLQSRKTWEEYSHTHRGQILGKRFGI